jgi:hypothetical protein
VLIVRTAGIIILAGEFLLLLYNQFIRSCGGEYDFLCFVSWISQKLLSSPVKRNVFKLSSSPDLLGNM